MPRRIPIESSKNAGNLGMRLPGMPPKRQKPFIDQGKLAARMAKMAHKIGKKSD
jgi:hypothetical protein